MVFMYNKCMCVCGEEEEEEGGLAGGRGLHSIDRSDRLLKQYCW